MAYPDELKPLSAKYQEKWGKKRVNYLENHVNAISQNPQESSFDLDLARADVIIVTNRGMLGRL